MKLKPGDKVRNKRDNSVVGRIAYSSFGISVLGIDRESGAHFQTLGDSPENVEKYWEPVSDAEYERLKLEGSE